MFESLTIVVESEVSIGEVGKPSTERKTNSPRPTTKVHCVSETGKISSFLYILHYTTY